MNASRRGAWVRGIATVALGLAAAAASGANVVAACGRCHGTGGEGRSAGAVPRIAGLPARYLAEQLEAFAAGRRPDPAMRSIAQALSASQRRAVAARYASLGPPSATSSTPSAAAPAGTAATRLAPAAAAVARGVLDGADAKGLIDGARLAMRGRWRTGVPACMQCHGPRGEGVGERFPPLVGQPREYLAAQLRAWRGGARWPGPLGLMAGVAGGLTEGQIEDVAAYFSAPESSRRAARALALELHASGRELEAPTAASAASPPPFAPPRWGDEPDGAFGRSVLAGERIFLDPRRYAPAYARAAIRCSGCHLDAGRRAGSAPLWAAFVAYPAYRRRGHRVETFAQRVQDCFRYSLNGVAPPQGGETLVALESYAFWLARGAAIGARLQGRGYPRLARPALAADPRRGAEVYRARCALCHGDHGQGRRSRDGYAAFPPLWGAASFNSGAGMASVERAASFIAANMPLGRGGTLDPQSAWDVARYIDGQPRPRAVR